jgi:hypothetical protein
MPSMRAKFRVIDVIKGGENYETIKFMPVSSVPYGPNGESEDNTYARYTPSGSCELAITNPNLVGQFEREQTFYVDFTPVEVAQATT